MPSGPSQASPARMGKEQSSKRPCGNTGAANGRSRPIGIGNRQPAQRSTRGAGGGTGTPTPTHAPLGRGPPPRAHRLIAAKYPSDDGTGQASGGTALGPLGRVVFHHVLPPRVLWFASVRPLPVPAAPARAASATSLSETGRTACRPVPMQTRRPHAGSQFFSRLSILLAPEGTA